MTYFTDVQEFHRAAKVPHLTAPGFPPEDRIALRLELIREEWAELQEAVASRDIVGIADALADIVYVACGAADEFGVPFGEVWVEVQRANMSKIPGAVWRPDGKLLKGPHYLPPDVAGVLEIFHGPDAEDYATPWERACRALTSPPPQVENASHD